MFSHTPMPAGRLHHVSVGQESICHIENDLLPCTPTGCEPIRVSVPRGVVRLKAKGVVEGAVGASVAIDDPGQRAVRTDMAKEELGRSLAVQSVPPEIGAT